MRNKEFNVYGVKEPPRKFRSLAERIEGDVFDMSEGGVIRRRQDYEQYVVRCAGVGPHGSYHIFVGARCVALRPEMAPSAVQF